MTRVEAISVLENPDVSIGVAARIGQDPEYWRKLKPALDMAISALRQHEQTPCSKCGYGGKHLDAPPCTTCPAHSKGQSQNETVIKCCDLYDEDGGEIFQPREPVTNRNGLNEPLTLDKLRKMGGEPVWCKEMQCYGIVKVEAVGRWANMPFLVGAWHDGDVAVNFEYDICGRKLTLYHRKPEEGTV